MSDNEPKALIKCFIERLIVSIDDFTNNDNYIQTHSGLLNIDFGLRFHSQNEKIICDLLYKAFIYSSVSHNSYSQTLIRNTPEDIELTIKYKLNSLVKEKFFINKQSSQTIVTIMHQAIDNIEPHDIIEIFNEIFSREKYTAIKKTCDDFYKNEACDEYKKFYPNIKPDSYLKLLDAFKVPELKKI